MKKNNTKTAGNQGIKEFRHEIALLKRKGLIDKKYDARSVTPTKYLKSQVKKFSSVLSGEATPVKVSKSRQAYYKELGYTVKNNRVVVPHLKNEKVYGSHGNFAVKVTGKFGSITRTDRGLRVKNIDQWREQLIKEFKNLKSNERLSFQIGGSFTDKTFATIETLLLFLMQYESYEQAEESENPDKEEQFIRAVVIYKIDRTSTMPRNVTSPEVIASRKARRAEAHQKYLDRMTPERQAQYNASRAELERERRERKKRKSTPQEIETEKQKARERAKKSYTARTGKNGKKDSGGN